MDIYGRVVRSQTIQASTVCTLPDSAPAGDASSSLSDVSIALSAAAAAAAAAALLPFVDENKSSISEEG
jgi:hypothetical protein